MTQACCPTLASARIRKVTWSPGELFEAELWLLHDGPDTPPPAAISAIFEIDERRYDLLSWSPETIEANRNTRGPKVNFRLPEFVNARFYLHLEAAQCLQWNSRYTLIKARDHSIDVGGAVEILAGATNF